MKLVGPVVGHRRARSVEKTPQEKTVDVSEMHEEIGENQP